MDPSSPDPLLLRSRSRGKERLIESFILGSGIFVIAAVVLIFVFLAWYAFPLITSSEVHEEVTIPGMILPEEGVEERPGEDFWRRADRHFPWQPVVVEPNKPQFKLLPLLVGTLKVTLVALLIGLPISIGAAIFTAEFAPQTVREVIKPAIEILAGMPSVVVGFFALMVISTVVQETFDLIYPLNAITAGIGLSLAVIPIVYTVSEDALSAVPQTFRDGSEALGANRWQTAWRVVLPAAMPGVFAACVLGAGRAIGETMIVLMASGNASTVSINLTESLRTFSATIAAEMGEVPHGTAHFHVLFFIGAVLFVITFFLNLAGQWYVTRLRKKLRG